MESAAESGARDGPDGGSDLNPLNPDRDEARNSCDNNKYYNYTINQRDRTKTMHTA